MSFLNIAAAALVSGGILLAIVIKANSEKSRVRVKIKVKKDIK